MSKLDTCFSHNSDDWATPIDVYNHFTKELFCITCNFIEREMLLDYE